MCGRYSLTPADLDRAIEERFGAVPVFSKWHPRYNAAPTQTLPVILNEDPRSVELAEWGLVPRWYPKRRLINAKAETVATKFRRAFEERRCLVPADSFYEWVTVKRVKTPQCFVLEPPGLFAFAGLWETDPTGGPAGDSTVLRFSIITTEANDLVRGIHARMPVILSRDAEETWLFGSSVDAQRALVPYPHTSMRTFPVSRRLNSPSHDDPTVLEPDPIQSIGFIDGTLGTT